MVKIKKNLTQVLKEEGSLEKLRACSREGEFNNVLKKF